MPDETTMRIMLNLQSAQASATLDLFLTLAGTLIYSGALRPDALRAALVAAADHAEPESIQQGLLIRARMELDASFNQPGDDGRPAWFGGVVDGGKDRA